MPQVELLAPAQNLKSIKAVVGIANAVYFGTETLNMRINADNLALKDFPSVVEFCHSNQLKAYLTTNVIVYESELPLVEKQLRMAKEAGIDAVIAHDMATIEIAREINLPFHISTQNSISNSRAALYYEKLGAERLILARECSLQQIKEITQKVTTAEIEAFVHGAQCTSVSGRCYFSAYVNEDPICSANRGKCLQPCRHKWILKHPNGTELDYHEGYFLNSKDLCMIGYIPQLMDAGIKSFKIEGRMRDPHYIQIVAKTYRDAINSVNDGSYDQSKVKQWLQTLKSVYNRGFSTGFYFGRPGPLDITVDSSGNQATSQKVQVGRVLSYYRNVKAAKIELHTGRLRLGDQVIFEGTKTGTYFEQKVHSMQIKTENVTETPTAKAKINKSVLVSLLVDNPVKKGDKIYRYIPKVELMAEKST
jgi:putative protease